MTVNMKNATVTNNWKIQVNTPLRGHLTVRISLIKVTEVGENIKKREPFYNVDHNEIRPATVDNGNGVSLK